MVEAWLGLKFFKASYPMLGLKTHTWQLSYIFLQ